MELLILESTDDDPVVKSSVKGIGSVSNVVPKTGQNANLTRTGSSQSPGGLGTLTHSSTSTSLVSISTNSSGKTLVPAAVEGGSVSKEKDEKAMYPFRIKHLGKEAYTLFAPTAAFRKEWCDKIIEAKTEHAASLFAQNAEPFRLRVMADSAFAYDTHTMGQKSIMIKGTPLSRAIKEVERTYANAGPPAPICRARVNCATTFNQPSGKQVVAIGTDYGVYVSEIGNPRGWTRVGICSPILIAVTDVLAGDSRSPSNPNSCLRRIQTLSPDFRQIAHSLPPRHCLPTNQHQWHPHPHERLHP